MIKRIQLRGISRTPSDRMNEDGGVAESLNAFIAENESAPVLPPEDMRDQLGLPEGDVYRKAIYIHKTSGKTNYIYLEKTEDISDIIWSYPDSQKIFETESLESIIEDSVVALGNTLIFTTSTGQNHYALYRDGKYVYMGSEIPGLDLEVKPNLYEGVATFRKTVILRNETTVPENLYKIQWRDWDRELEKDECDRAEEFSTIKNELWEGVQDALLGSSYFRYPVFVRFAIKLGGSESTYVRHTVPILLGGGHKRIFDAKLKYEVMIPDRGATKYKTSAEMWQDWPAYRILSRLKNATDFDNWKDVIQSIDMFISAPIIYPEINSEIVGITAVESGDSCNVISVRFQDEEGTKDEKESIKNAILDGSRIYYKVKSFSLENLQELVDGLEIKNSKELSYLENLATRENLPDDFRSNHTYGAERNYIINHRLISIGLTETFGRGMPSLFGLKPTNRYKKTETTLKVIKEYSFAYEIKDNDGTKKIVKSEESLPTSVMDYAYVNPGGSRQVGTTVEYEYNSDMIQLIFYPDTRCCAVYVTNETGKSIRLPMYAHPYLNCSYYLGDISSTLSDLTFSSSVDVPEEDRKGDSYNGTYLFQSALENPFYYPVSGRQRFNSTIIAVASISTALSEGQFGQFDLYIFTDEGIWVLKPNSEGVYLETKPLSRDVCLSPKSVVCIDQAVVFVTARGVMLLDGSRISNISPNMNGRHYSMEESAIQVLKDCRFGQYEKTLVDKTPFMKFMADERNGGLQIAYDYTGGRLLFFNDRYEYSYLYMLGSATWHKQSTVEPHLHNLRVLNSYPECLLFGTDIGEVHHIYNLSTILDVLDETTEVKCVIATRPFDLGEPDILKTINDIKVRGLYETIRKADIHKYLEMVSGGPFANEIEVEEYITGMFDIKPNDWRKWLDGQERWDITNINTDVIDIDEVIDDLKASFSIEAKVVEEIVSPRVKYILLGSQDGIHFTRLGTLRGKSWKLFRMIILANLRPTERISWIDIDFTTRFTNKLR